MRSLGLFAALSVALAVAAPVGASASAPMAFDAGLVHRGPDGASSLSVRDGHGTFDAIEHGDEPAVQAIQTRLAEASRGSTSVMDTCKIGVCDMAIARVRGDVDGADATLDRMARNFGALGDRSGRSIRSTS
ncbi:hypothetical protein [Lichenicola sp.]|uniref:hypothetical protein n=1 Tax=Lichenicola sp. TaxID=2804529 RepID=UPI003B00427B